MWRWLVGLFSRRGSEVVSESFREMHRMVIERFPETPWVYGGVWSWFSSSLRCLPGVIVYPYLPLVLIDSESYDLSLFADVLKSCSVYGVPVVTVSDGQSQFMMVLSRLEERK